MRYSNKSMSKVFFIEPNHLASCLGSGGLKVLGTPALISFMENCAFELLEKNLNSGQTSVGIFVETTHIKPSRAGEKVQVSAEITDSEDNTVFFQIEARSEGTLIGQALHKRVIIDKDAFIRKHQLDT